MKVEKAYAKALYLVAIEQKDEALLDKLQSELTEIEAVLAGSKDLKRALFSPVAGAKEKANIVVEIAKKMGLSTAVTHFMELLAKKQRLAVLEHLAQVFKVVRLEAQGGTMGLVESADVLSPQDVEELAKAFGTRLGKKVAFGTKVDPTLLAGIKVTVNGVTYDGTLRSQLQRLRDRLVHGTELTH